MAVDRVYPFQIGVLSLGSVRSRFLPGGTVILGEFISFFVAVFQLPSCVLLF